jgi:hypothetical protein
MTNRQMRAMALTGLLTVAIATIGTAHPASAQSTFECSDLVYRGLQCEGLFTDEPDLVADPDRIDAAIDRVSSTHGNPFGVVIASDTRGEDPVDFAVNLANAWGVGDPDAQNGILVLVAVAERRTEVVTQEAVDLPGTAIANAGRSFFAAGDFEGGVLAIIGSVDQVLSGEYVEPPASDAASGVTGWLVVGGIAVFGAVVAGGAVAGRRRRDAEALRSRRRRQIDLIVDGLTPRGDEIVASSQVAITVDDAPPTDTGTALRTLFDIRARRADRSDPQAVLALGAARAISLVDVDDLRDRARIPIELRTSGERHILEAGLEGSIEQASAAVSSSEEVFDIAIDELEAVVRSLRPHRVAAARHRSAEALIDQLAPTPAGPAAIEDLGSLLMRSAPVLDETTPLTDTITDVESARETAITKVNRLEAIRSAIPASDTRDVASIALADLTDDPAAAVSGFTTTLDALTTHGAALEADGISLPAVAALLVMNNSDHDVPGFVSAYERLRATHSPSTALEGAAAGLFTDEELDAAKRLADGLGLPIAVAIALRERRDDGPEVYRSLLARVAGEAGGEDAKVIAGVLAVSLEPPLAFDRWSETRRALAALGLSGSYADVAAAFGASDPRGPRAFALAYAAQRSALEDAGYSSLTRYAPELAHAGTSRREDSWTGRPLSTARLDFDPFTFFYLHWAASGGRHGGSGWSDLYSSPSWNDGGSSWWGGGGGFAAAGGSTWAGGGGFGGGGFGGGGFGGGGGFSGGGGGGW